MLSVRNTSEHSALRCRACAPSGARAGGAGLPRHVIHPRDGKPGLWDVYGRALCPTCGALWQRSLNTAVIVSRDHAGGKFI